MMGLPVKMESVRVEVSIGFVARCPEPDSDWLADLASMVVLDEDGEGRPAFEMAWHLCPLADANMECELSDDVAGRLVVRGLPTAPVYVDGSGVCYFMRGGLYAPAGRCLPPGEFFAAAQVSG